LNRNIEEEEEEDASLAIECEFDGQGIYPEVALVYRGEAVLTFVTRRYDDGIVAFISPG
jgi:hypothetical protein